MYQLSLLDHQVRHLQRSNSELDLRAELHELPGIGEHHPSANSALFAANYYLGFAYRAKQEWDRCSSNFDSFLEQLDDSSQVPETVRHATREGGLCHARGSTPERAIPLLQEAATANPNDKQVRFYLGVTLMRATRHDEAERAFLKAIQLDPKLAYAHYYAGRLSFNREEWVLALERLT